MKTPPITTTIMPCSIFTSVTGAQEVGVWFDDVVADAKHSSTLLTHEPEPADEKLDHEELTSTQDPPLVRKLL